MVRRGSTVRVRQRASQKYLQSGNWVKASVVEVGNDQTLGDRFWGQGRDIFTRSRSVVSIDLATAADRFDYQPSLSGGLLQLRPLHRDDFAALHAAASDPRIWEQHP